MIESDDANIDLAGVISTEAGEYTVKFNIQNTSVFNDTSAVFQAEYLPIIDSEI